MKKIKIIITKRQQPPDVTEGSSPTKKTYIGFPKLQGMEGLGAQIPLSESGQILREVTVLSKSKLIFKN